MKISKRLETVSSFIQDNSKIIDVGCDHALLDIYLFKTKKNVKIIASDVKKGPIEHARENINKYNCDIKVKQGYGIDTIENDIDTVVITGMGGETIISILDKGIDKLNNVDTLIISPQSEWSKVRQKITSMGFYIDLEKIIEEEGKYYLIEKYKRGNKTYTQKELEFGPLLLKNKDEFFRQYYQKIIIEKKYILKKIPFYKVKKRLIEKNKIKYLKKILKHN